MIGKEVLKEMMLSNEDYILNKVQGIVSREGVFFPEKLKKVVVLYGVRRSGKTYILYDLFRKNRAKAFYADFEDERLSDFKADDFETLKDACLEIKPDLAGKEIMLLLDEVQNIPGWEKFARRISERENIRVFISGSSSKVMPKEIQTSLRGRSWSIQVFPFSFKEFLTFKGIKTDKSAFYGKNRIMIKKHLKEYLKWGGFPEILFLKTDIEKHKILGEYLDAMFFKDLVERFNVTNSGLLSLLMETVFSSFSAKFSLTAFYKQYKQKIPFSKDILFVYHKYLLESMLIYETRKFSESSYKRTRNPAKIYAADNGLCKMVSSENYGRVLENTVFLELKRRNHDIFYYAGDWECDFIARDKELHFAPVQVTFELTDKNRDREISGLIEACKELAASSGKIITFDQKEKIKVKNIGIDILPVWEWLLS